MVYWLEIQSFYEAFSLPLLLTVFLHIVITALLLCLQVSLHVAVTSQESVFMPSAWRSRLHTSLKRSWGRPVGLFPVASSPYKRSFKSGHLSSVSHVLSIACAFALRECIS